MIRFLKASGCDRQKHNPRYKLAFDGDARDMVDGIAGVKNNNSSVMFVSWRTCLSCWRRITHYAFQKSFFPVSVNICNCDVIYDVIASMQSLKNFAPLKPNILTFAMTSSSFFSDYSVKLYGLTFITFQMSLVYTMSIYLLLISIWRQS